MRRRRLVPPPSKATAGDAYRTALGVLMIPLGIYILVRVWQTAGTITLPGAVMGLAFVGFGVYRLYVAVVRYRMYQAMHKGKQ